jgi:hypothetical protein
MMREGMTSAAKAASIVRALCGTAEAVPLSKTISSVASEAVPLSKTISSAASEAVPLSKMISSAASEAVPLSKIPEGRHAR